MVSRATIETQSKSDYASVGVAPFHTRNKKKQLSDIPNEIAVWKSWCKCIIS